MEASGLLSPPLSLGEDERNDVMGGCGYTVAGTKEAVVGQRCWKSGFCTERSVGRLHVLENLVVSLPALSP